MDSVDSPPYLVSTDANGDIAKTDIKKLRYRNIDGGFANCVYLATQQIDGGSSVATGSSGIDGGNA